MVKKNENKKKIKLAVFDIDGTIFRSSLLIELINELVRSGVFPQKAKKEMEKDYLAWLNRKGTYDAYINRVVKIHLKNIGGCRERDVLAIARDVISWHKNRVYRFTRDLIRELHKKQFYIIALSASPQYIVSMFADSMGFDGAFGTRYEVRRGIFTGRMIDWDPEIHTKDTLLESVISTLNAPVDFRRSIAVGDTESDIPMLKMVGNPIAFNPNKSFALYAKRKGWRIVVERKDTIYDIKQFNLIRP